jgi:hypothetical protein
MMIKYFIFSLVIIATIKVKSQENMSFLDSMKLRSIVISSDFSLGSGFIAYSEDNWNYVFTAKHVVPENSVGLGSDLFLARVFNSEATIPCEVLYRDSKYDFAILRFQSDFKFNSTLSYDSIIDINSSYFLVSAINGWSLRPQDTQKSYLKSLTNDGVTQRIYMTGVDTGDSGSGFFSERGLAGIVWFKDGDIIWTISSSFMRRKLDIILEDLK